MVNNNNSSEQEDQQQREPAAADKRNPWYEYNIANNEKSLNETIVTLRLTKKHYKTVYTFAHMLVSSHLTTT